jgi:succinate dehydrogenase hydrophobic anchor subunit
LTFPANNLRFQRVTGIARANLLLFTFAGKVMFPYIASESVLEAVQMAVTFFSLLTAMIGLLVARQA